MLHRSPIAERKDAFEVPSNGNDAMTKKEVVPTPSTGNLNKRETKPSEFGQLKPVFLNEHQRSFGNPISYLGGPQLPSRNRWSIESVMSLD